MIMLKNTLLIKMLPLAALVVVFGSSAIGCTDTKDPTTTTTQQPTTTSQAPTTTTLPDVPGEAVYEGMYTYDDFKKPETCGICHQTIYSNWQETLMAKSFVHTWDDVEYFELALPHAM
ncbi:MAG: hypothetical protein PHQ10_04915, partial [Dehalococcoidales bacterium]|nr:hypothetical protein [Dehalococcoidales bacterium]MDX9803794.1 hypothetical protein [Dehalococcoidales bacterium]